MKPFAVHSAPSSTHRIQPKAKWTLVLCTLCIGLCLRTTVCNAQNVASNPGFETGSTTGWIPFGPASISAQSTTVHSGAYAASVTDRSATWNGIAQSFQGVLSPGSSYSISIWVRMAGGGSQTVQLTMSKTDGGGTTYTPIANASVSTGSWVQLSGQYTLNTSGTLSALVLYVEVPTSSSAALYVDDLSVQENLSGSTGLDGERALIWNDVQQRIDGFGASSAWRSSWTTALADMFFSTNSGTGMAQNGSPYSYTGIGLSLLRSRIVPGATTVEQTIMQMAQARGARVWSAPWSPAPQFKSNGNVNGGSFVGNAANYQAYANQLAGYVANMKSQYGVNLYALSVQNEPDANVTTYESCNWTAQQIHDFIPYLHDALLASNVGGTKIMLPESQNWTDPQGLRLTTMNDAATAALVDIIANHNYVPNNALGDQNPPAAINHYGKALWETEVAKLSGSDSSIGDGIYWAQRVHLFMTVAQANAWHYWWLCAYGTGNEGLCDDNDVPAKRMYTLGNYSRFVRPGFHRIGATNSGTTMVSAYKDLTNGRFAIVAINSATNAVVQTFHLDGFDADSVTPWITSSALSLAGQSTVTVSNATFAYQLPARCVVTFVGQAAQNSPPSLTTPSDQMVSAGVSLVLTNIATDPDTPAQTLTYSMIDGPDNATLDSATGVFAWRPRVDQQTSTNTITVAVMDNGSPSLGTTNSFTITVSPLDPPMLSSITPTGLALSLGVTGPLGPDYILWSSTNLSDWQTLATNTPDSLPFTFAVTNTDPQRFYFLELGP